MKRPRLTFMSHYSAERNKILHVVFPLNVAVTAAWWVNVKWAEKANSPSWIEREIHKRRTTVAKQKRTYPKGCLADVISRNDEIK